MKTYNPEQLKKKITQFGATMSKSEFQRTFPCYKKRAGEFRGKNWSFNPLDLYADSYGWWPMLAVINGVLVRNNFGYSSSTGKHQGKLWRILYKLGIKADIQISVRASLHKPEKVAAELLRDWAELEVKNKYGREETKNPYLKQIATLIDARIIKKVSKKAMKEALKEAEADRKCRLDNSLTIKNIKKLATDKIAIEVRSIEEFGLHAVPGRYCQPDNLYEVERMVAACEDNEEATTVYVYLKRKSKPAAPAERPKLKLVKR